VKVYSLRTAAGKSRHTGTPQKCFLLRVEAGAERPLVQQRLQRPRLDEAKRLRVRKDVERELERHAELQQSILRRPGILHGAVVRRLRTRIGACGVRERHQRP
jgi:hypothetical protein